MHRYCSIIDISDIEANYKRQQKQKEKEEVNCKCGKNWWKLRGHLPGALIVCDSCFENRKITVEIGEVVKLVGTCEGRGELVSCRGAIFKDSKGNLICDGICQGNPVLDENFGYKKENRK